MSHDSTAAGVAAARDAVAGLGGAVSAVLVFATAGHDQQRLIDGVRSVTGGAPLSGCSGSGIITGNGSDESSHSVAVMAFTSDSLRFRALLVEYVAADHGAAGRNLVEQVGRGVEPALLMLFPDGLTANVTALLRELSLGLPSTAHVFGGAASETEFQRTYQYCDGRVVSGGVSALVIDGDAEVEFGVSHGCDTMSIEHEVTRSDGGLVHELDGRPAWDVMREYIGADTEDLDAEHMPYFCLGQRLPEAAAKDYGEFVIRVPLQLDKDSGALFFPGELREGERVAMARREPQELIERAVAAARELGGARSDLPLFVIHIDCVGRGCLLFGESASARLVEPVLDGFGASVPWIGFHSNGEIAPIAGSAYFHNYTMALCAVYELER